MRGKNAVKAAALFLTGMTVGYLLSERIGFACFRSGPEESGDGEDRPPLRVKPVPIVKKKEQGDTEA